MRMHNNARFAPGPSSAGSAGPDPGPPTCSAAWWRCSLPARAPDGGGAEVAAAAAGRSRQRSTPSTCPSAAPPSSPTAPKPLPLPLGRALGPSAAAPAATAACRRRRASSAPPSTASATASREDGDDAAASPAAASGTATAAAMSSRTEAWQAPETASWRRMEPTLLASEPASVSCCSREDIWGGGGIGELPQGQRQLILDARPAAHAREKRKAIGRKNTLSLPSHQHTCIYIGLLSIAWPSVRYGGPAWRTGVRSG